MNDLIGLNQQTMYVSQQRPQRPHYLASQTRWMNRFVDGWTKFIDILMDGLMYAVLIDVRIGWGRGGGGGGCWFFLE